MLTISQHTSTSLADSGDDSLCYLEYLLNQFDAISLPEVQDAALLDRVDTKYIIGLEQLFAILQQISEHYRALSISDTRLHAYQTLYFDTDSFTFYSQHHNGVASRCKVRVRRYVDTDTAFFEIKHRNNQCRTVKSRLPVADVVTRLDGSLVEFAYEHAIHNADNLEPKLWNEYARMTLVSKHRPERVTLDVNLQYHWEDARVTLPGIVIVEVKRASLSQAAEFIRQMRRLGIRPTAYSKYAAGVYSLYDGLKANNFKPQMRRVNKIMQGMRDHEYAD